MQPSNPALRSSLELLRPAPLRCGDGIGHSEQCGRNLTRKKAARPQEILSNQINLIESCGNIRRNRG